MFDELNDQAPDGVGRIEIITGSMFSGKTEELMRRLRRARYAKRRVRVFKPIVDTRYSADSVVSHDSNSLSCIQVSSASQIVNHLGDADVVGIDEAQFFGPELVDVCQSLASDGIRVIVAGLDMDYLGRPFGPMPNLMAVAEHVTKVHAICADCGALAHYSHRISDSNQLLVLGEKDVYEPLCRACFIKAVVREGQLLSAAN